MTPLAQPPRRHLPGTLPLQPLHNRRPDLLNRPNQPLHRLPRRLNIHHTPEELPIPDSILIPTRRSKIHHEPLTHNRMRNLLRDLTIRLPALRLIRDQSARMHVRTVRRIMEAHLQTRRRVLADEDEVGVLFDQRSEVRCHGTGGVDLLLVPGRAVVGPAEEELEGVCATAALEGEVREVPDLRGVDDEFGLAVEGVWCSGGGVVVVEEVAGGEGIGEMEATDVGGEEEGAGDGDAEHFVGVDGDAVCFFGTGEFGALGGGEDEGAAPGAVDVEPQVVFLADGGDFVEGVEGAQDGGAGGGVDVEGGAVLGEGLLDQGFELRGDHAALFVDGDGPDGGAAETEHLGGLFDAVVAVGAGEEHEAVVAIAVFLGAGVEVVARDHDRGGVGGRASLDGDASGAGAIEAEERGELLAGVFLNDGQGWGDLVDVDVGVERRQDKLRRYAGGVGGCIKLVEESLVPCVDRVAQNLAQDFDESVLSGSLVGEV